jgi:phosphoenolpyruvate synthase/pyruvate phosphate dikinase
MRMAPFVLHLQEINETHGSLTGGKGAHLGALSRIDRIRVPAGFCVTTDAFRRVMASALPIEPRLDHLARLKPDDRHGIRACSAEIRDIVDRIAVPGDVAAAVDRAIRRLSEHDTFAVRSSATAEDLPTASFAGQHDTYLNVLGPAILGHIRLCWASLFTERAVIYRMRNGIEHRAAQMAVVVQQMVCARAAGILFTADPVNGSRKVASIEASFGLGEAIASGVVNPDVYRVRDGAIIERRMGTKQTATRASPAGGTCEIAVDPAQRELPALEDPEVVRLVELGRQLEAHFGAPQDIEWCLADQCFYILQSRPITTLFPIPAASGDGKRVYLSVGHQQMMTDPLKPLGLSFYQMARRHPMAEAGGWLFADVTRRLASPAGPRFLKAVGRQDPLMGDALRTILKRGDLAAPPPDETSGGASPAATPIATDPAIVEDLIRRNEDSIAALKREIRTKSGMALFECIRLDLQELNRVVFDPKSHEVIMAGLTAGWWLTDHLHAWLGDRNAADALAQSTWHNVTSQMGLALLDVADVIRPHADVVAFLKQRCDDDFLDQLPTLAGGREARDAIQAWLDLYGMRGVGEMDITRPRWSERPALLIPILRGHIENAVPGGAARRFEEGRQAALKHEEEVLARLRALPDGERKAVETKRMIDRVRTFSGHREYPKYGMVCRFVLYKQALMREAARLVHAGVIRAEDDIFFLRFEELEDAVRTNRVEERLVQERREAFRSYHALTPPRVMTSEGEIIAASYRHGAVPAGALIGVPVSAGVIEGRARVVLDVANADLRPGDILVTTYTDPSWTALFVAIGGLVTEVGGLTSHGSVIAREYGLPAVVGVESATRRIRDGQRIRLHGAEGYVEILS